MGIPYRDAVYEMFEQFLDLGRSGSIKGKLGGYVDQLYEECRSFIDGYNEMPEEDRYNIEKNIFSYAGSFLLYLGATITGHPEVASLHPLIQPLFEELYDAYKKRDFYSLSGAFSKLKSEILNIPESEPVDESIEESGVEEEPAVYRPLTPALAALAALAMLGLGFSFRVGLETTGKIGAVTPTSLPLVATFSSILLFLGYVLFKNKR